MRPGKLTAADIPAVHPEWVQRDHMLIAWAMSHRLIILRGPGNYSTGWDIAFPSEHTQSFPVVLDPFGLPVLTEKMRQRLGDEWRKWKDSQP